MSIPASSGRASALPLRSGPWYDPSLRVGDAERSEVADRLAQHYSAGRLDHAEFSERLDRAMKAKTASELIMLLADMPGAEPVRAMGSVGSRRQQRRMLRLELERRRMQLRQEQRHYRQAERRQRAHALRWIPLLAGLVVVAVILFHALAHSTLAWIVIGLIACLWLTRRTQG